MAEKAFIFPDDPQPRWANEDKTMIDCMVILPHLSPDPIPYTAAKVDPGWEHSEKIFDILFHEDLGIPVAPYVPPAPAPEPLALPDLTSK